MHEIMKVISVDDMHRQNLADTRVLVTTLIECVKQQLIAPTMQGVIVPEERYTSLWGEKENAVSLLVKLTGLLVKIIPLERELTQGEMAGEMVSLSEEDEEILARYEERVRACHTPG